MIDGNISMEEDTELRDLVVQTLENNGVLAKLRAELRASVFLALEEQEAVANPEPLLNKTVKQYLADDDGKLLFSLVREFLEYFGLDYTISVYDSETYFGKEYDYPGRNKLSDKLGLGTDEPLLGELLKNSINTALDDTRKSLVDELKRADEKNGRDATFQVLKSTEEKNGEATSPSNDNDSSDKVESISDGCPDLPINVTITDKKKRLNETTSPVENRGYSEIGENETRANNNVDSRKLTSSRKREILATSDTVANKDTTSLRKETERSMALEVETNEKEELPSERVSIDLRITNSAPNKLDEENNIEKSVRFEERTVDERRQRVTSSTGVTAATAIRKSESLLGELPPLLPKSKSIFGDLPPLNGQKTDINDLKELMDIGLGVDGSDNYEEDFVSSASGSANEQSPIKDSDPESPDQSTGVLSGTRKTRKKRETSYRSATRNDDMSEDVDEIEEVFSNVSCLEDTSGDNGISNFPRAITADCNDVS